MSERLDYDIRWATQERTRGNNSLSYPIPADQYPPVVRDFFLGVVSSGTLFWPAKKAEKIPLGWTVDKEGLPTDDPYGGYERGGSLIRLGAHKGYGMALVS